MSSKKILVVDDEPSIRTVMAAVLENEGYTVAVAEDGYDALRKIQQQAPDLLITDLRMPNMDGFELLSVVRGRFPEMPTVAISGEFLRSGADEGLLAEAFFQKGSYALCDFLRTIAELLATSPRRRRVTAPQVWRPTGDAQLTMTCSTCRRSFPMIPSDDAPLPHQTTCLFCGEILHVRLASAMAASGPAASAADSLPAASPTGSPLSTCGERAGAQGAS